MTVQYVGPFVLAANRQPAPVRKAGAALRAAGMVEEDKRHAVRLLMCVSRCGRAHKELMTAPPYSGAAAAQRRRCCSHFLRLRRPACLPRCSPCGRALTSALPRPSFCAVGDAALALVMRSNDTKVGSFLPRNAYMVPMLDAAVVDRRNTGAMLVHHFQRFCLCSSPRTMRGCPSQSKSRAPVYDRIDIL